MPEFELISDEAMFEARRYIVDDGRYPDLLGRGRPGLNNVLELLEGRHRFWVHPTKDAKKKLDSDKDALKADIRRRSYVTLRIDRENKRISGDLHEDIGRKKWKFSWASEALFQIDHPKEVCPRRWSEHGWNLFAVCSVFPSQSGTGTGTSPEAQPKTLALAIRIKRARITAIRLILSDATGRVKETADLSMTDPEVRDLFSKATPKRTFRYYEPIHIADAVACNDYTDLIEEAVGARGEKISAFLNKNDTKIFWHNRVGDDGELLKCVDNAPPDEPFRLLTPFQWSDDPYRFVILFSSEVKEGSLGSVLGLDEPNNPLNKVRLGAIVRVKEAIRSVLCDPEADWKEGGDRVPELIRNIYVHELGHLLNLPHSWQRGHFRNPPLPSNPSARTWMAYGSRFPLGDFMITSRKQIVKIKKKEFNIDIDLDDLMKYDSDNSKRIALRNSRFTKIEKEWIWHASFDNASPGGPFFTKVARKPLELRSPSKEKNFCLRLELEKSDEDNNNTYIKRHGTHYQFSREALFGYVSFRFHDEDFKKNPFHFAFQSPMLSILVREEYPLVSDRNWARKVRELPAVQFPSDWKFNDNETATDLSHIFHEKAIRPITVPDDADGFGKLFIQPIPFVDFIEFTKQGFSDPGSLDIFTLQAVLRPVGRDPIYSNMIKVKFEPSKLKYTEAEADVLLDKNLPEFLNSIAYFDEKRDISLFHRPNLHRDGHEESPAFTELIRKIDNLGQNRSGLSPGLFEYIACTEAIRKNHHHGISADFGDIPPFVLPLVRHYLQEESDLIEKYLNQQNRQWKGQKNDSGFDNT